MISMSRACDDNRICMYSVVVVNESLLLVVGVVDVVGPSEGRTRVDKEWLGD